MQKKIILIAAILGAGAVVLSASGAHFLGDYLRENNYQDTYETAVKYHFYHTIVLLLIGLMAHRIKPFWKKLLVILFTGGILLFSGSLYLISLFHTSFLGWLTPIGGLLLIAGWVSIGITAYFGWQNGYYRKSHKS